MDNPSGTSATKGRLRKVGSLSLRSSRLTDTVVLAVACSEGVPPKEGDRGTYKVKHTQAHTHTQTHVTEFISHSKNFHGRHKT